MTAEKEKQLAMSIGLAVMAAIREYEPEKTVLAPVRYMTVKQLSENFGLSAKTVRNIIGEIRAQMHLGRYPERTSILDGSKITVNTDVFSDYLKNRKMLKDPTARKHVKEYKERLYYDA